ncbi:ATPase_AAA_core domain-containing protein [Pseudomonas sp. OF001]|jgi:hypothetical protein|uniref:AAA family ATPase n=1 Tax=Pseudomonas sp. OF001 TaxID=2772300 RepID=UPI00198B7812|nr:AAA family ATPase [Pseudomonas sp. OF001]CAD5375481.1 ATPase_AAA_core domain-containing protein [Pseudomonas sp. OF001]
MFKKIWSTELDRLGYRAPEIDTAEEQRHINLRKLNLFIGPNNSGKSRAIRAVFSSTEDSIITQQPRGEIADIFLPLIKLHYKDRIFEKNTIAALQTSEASINKINENTGIIHAYAVELYNQRASGGTLSQMRQTLRNEGLTKKLEIALETDRTHETIKAKIHYTPILRGMRPIGEGQGDQDHYRKRTEADYFSGKLPPKRTITTGLHLYELLVKNLLGQPEERAKIREYESLLGQEFFGGTEVTLIPEYGKDTVAVKIGDEPQFPIYHLGDGLQQVIIITSAAYLEPEESLFCIEEPETSLHPGLLRQLALFLLQHTPHQYLMTTHSNHLLDLAEQRDDVLIHRVSKSVEKDGKASFLIRECTRDRDILLDLGVRASSVYLANCTIWVEGISDRLYLRTWMSRYLHDLPEGPEKSRLAGYLENYHYTFIEYQGGTLGHWDFADDDVDGDMDKGLSAIRACSAPLLIADGDIRDKGQRAELLQKELGDQLLILDGKEIENLLPEQVLHDAARTFYDQRRTNKEGLDITKIQDLKHEHYSRSTEGIGRLLDKRLGLSKTGQDQRQIFATDSGTIRDKVKFCRLAIQHMQHEDCAWQLTDELRRLCQRIFAHIDRHNQP